MRSTARTGCCPVSISYPEGDPGREDELIREIAARWNADVHWLDIQNIPFFDHPAERAAVRDEPFAHPFEMWHRSLARGTRATNSRVALEGVGGDQLFQVSEVYLADLLRTGRLTELAREWKTKGMTGSGFRNFFRWAIQPNLPRPALAARARAARRTAAPSPISSARSRPGSIRALREHIRSSSATVSTRLASRAARVPIAKQPGICRTSISRACSARCRRSRRMKAWKFARRSTTNASSSSRSRARARSDRRARRRKSCCAPRCAGCFRTPFSRRAPSARESPKAISRARCASSCRRWSMRLFEHSLLASAGVIDAMEFRTCSARVRTRRAK